MKLIRRRLRACAVSGEKPLLEWVLHRILPVEEEPKLVAFLNKALSSSQHVDMHLHLLKRLLLHARPFALDSLIDLKHGVRTCTAVYPAEAAIILDIIATQINYKSPVLGRWHSNPFEDTTRWMDWNAKEIAVNLNAICEPFLRLRACEFNAQGKAGTHLKHLNDIGSGMSFFVAVSILVAATASPAQGVQAVSLWFGVMRELYREGNFHMLHAVQMGLGKHQVDRLIWLWKDLPRKVLKIKKEMDNLFDLGDRMTKLAALWTERAGQQPTIMSIFWLVQKATLLEESPLVVEGEKLNVDQLAAADHVFQLLEKMQSKWYAKSPCDDEAKRWYFLQIPRALSATSIDELEERMYALSDQVRVKGGSKSDSGRRQKQLRPSLDDGMSASSSDYESASEDTLSETHRSMKKSVSIPVNLGVGKLKPTRKSAEESDSDTLTHISMRKSGSIPVGFAIGGGKPTRKSADDADSDKLTRTAVNRLSRTMSVDSAKK